MELFVCKYFFITCRKGFNLIAYGYGKTHEYFCFIIKCILKISFLAGSPSLIYLKISLC
jgi:hypothetical protein